MNYRVAVVQLPLVREPGSQMVRTPADAHRICADLAGLAQESFHVLSLNSRHRLINRHMISLGLVDSALVAPREAFRAAISDGATAIVLVHNHPTGDPTPSEADVRITKQMVEAGRAIDIRVADHVIIGRREQGGDGQPARPAFLSLREAGMCTFE